MKIYYKEPKKKLSEINTGEVFLFDGRYYLKIEKRLHIGEFSSMDTFHAIDLIRGTHFILNETYVDSVEGHFQVTND